MKLTSELIRYINTRRRPIIPQDLLILIQSKQDILMLEKNYNTSEYFGFHENKKYTRNQQDIERDHKDLVNKSLELGSRASNSLLKRTLQDLLFAYELSLSLRKVRFNKPEFPAGKPILDIKYYHPGFHNNNFSICLLISQTMYLPTFLQILKLQKTISTDFCLIH